MLRRVVLNFLRELFALQLNMIKSKHNKDRNGSSAAIHCSLHLTIPLSLFPVPETLDRKHFQQEGMCVHTSSVKGPPQVCAQTSCSVPSGDCHGNAVIVWCE